MSNPTGIAAAPPDEPGGRPLDARAREALSCFADGELDAAESAAFVRSLCSDPEARREWTLLHVVGDALRSTEVASMHSDTFVARVAQALEAEPAIVAPHARRDTRRIVRRVVLPGVAVAAAAAVLAIVAVPQLAAPDLPAPATVVSLPAAPAKKADAPIPVVSMQAPPAPTVGPSAVGQVERLPELDAYLAAHREQSGTPVMLRSAPYLRTSATVPR